MRFTIFLVIFSFAIQAYGQDHTIYEGDTINRVDQSNMKQGRWVIFGKMKKLPGYGPDQIIEEGEYVNGRKMGPWKKYYPSGEVQNEITFKNNRPNGPYTTYYPNGQVEEKGTWKNNRNIGTFQRFYENGNPQQEFNFAENGKRTGDQKYFHENGQLMIEGNWEGGKEKGEIKEYYADGNLKSIKVFNEGQIDPDKTEAFDSDQPVVLNEPEQKTTKISPKVDNTDQKPNIGPFNGTGTHTLYNKNRQVSQKGYFRNYRLINGEWYRYDDNGILISIEIYKNGKYVGEGVLPEEK